MVDRMNLTTALIVILLLNGSVSAWEGRRQVKSSSTSRCGMYLAPSSVPGAGRGIIAGRPYNMGEIIEITQTIAMSNRILLEYTQLSNYVYSLGEAHCMILFGAGSLYNHNKRFSTKHHWIVSPENQVQPRDTQWAPYSMADDVWFRATENVTAGEEMYAYYGDGWFIWRGIAEMDLVNGTTSGDDDDLAPSAEPLGSSLLVDDDERKDLVSAEDLEQHGHCLTDVGASHSSIVFAGKGLFARRPFKRGEVVTVAPVLALSRRAVETTVGTSVLMNYCFTLPGDVTDVTLFPLNNGASINHQPAESANVELGWHDWSLHAEGSYFEHANGEALRLASRLALTPAELFAAPFAQLDVAFRATRDIADGEEIALDYGYSWGLAWNEYVEQLRAWEAARQEQQQEQQQQQRAEAGHQEEGEEPAAAAPEIDTSTLPVFRSFIEVPQGMFPAHWLR